MPVISDASDIKLGSQSVSSILKGSTSIWSGIDFGRITFDLNERQLDGGTQVDVGGTLYQTVWPDVSQSTGSTFQPLDDTPDAVALLNNIPVWTPDSDLWSDWVWGHQGNNGMDIVILVKRPSDNSIWAAEGPYYDVDNLPQGTGAIEPDWDSYDPDAFLGVYEYTYNFDRVWYPVDDSFPTLLSWTPGMDMTTAKLIEVNGYIFISYPYATQNSYVSGAQEPNFIGAADSGQYVSDFGGYWWPLGLSGEPVTFTYGIFDAVAGDGGRSEDSLGFIVGEDEFGSTLTARYDSDSAMYVPQVWQTDPDRTMYLIWIPGEEYNGYLDNIETCPIGFSEDEEGGYYSDAYGWGETPEDSYFEPYDLLREDGYMYGAVQFGIPLLMTIVDCDTDHFGIVHIDGPECDVQTINADDSEFGTDYGGLLLANYTGGGYCAPGRWVRVVGYREGHNAQQRSAKRDELISWAAQYGIIIEKREEEQPQPFVRTVSGTVVNSDLDPLEGSEIFLTIDTDGVITHHTVENVSDSDGLWSTEISTSPQPASWRVTASVVSGVFASGASADITTTDATGLQLTVYVSVVNIAPLEPGDIGTPRDYIDFSDISSVDVDDYGPGVGLRTSHVTSQPPGTIVLEGIFGGVGGFHYDGDMLNGKLAARGNANDVQQMDGTLPTGEELTIPFMIAWVGRADADAFTTFQYYDHLHTDAYVVRAGEDLLSDFGSGVWGGQAGPAYTNFKGTRPVVIGETVVIGLVVQESGIWFIVNNTVDSISLDHLGTLGNLLTDVSIGDHFVTPPHGMIGELVGIQLSGETELFDVLGVIRALADEWGATL